MLVSGVQTVIPKIHTLQNAHHDKRRYHLPPCKVTTIPLTIFLMLCFTSLRLILFHFRKDFIHLFTQERHIQRERQRHGEREEQAPCREPNAGLDHRTLGSRPGPKADTEPLSPPGTPTYLSYNYKFVPLHPFHLFCPFPHPSG